MNKIEPKRIPYEDIQERADMIADVLCDHTDFSEARFKEIMCEMLSRDCSQLQHGLSNWSWIDRIRLVREITSRVQIQRE